MKTEQDAQAKLIEDSKKRKEGLASEVDKFDYERLTKDRDYTLEKAQADATVAKTKAETQKINDAISKNEGNLTKGQIALDREYAKDHLKWNSGARAKSADSIKALEGSITLLNEGSGSGRVAGLRSETEFTKDQDTRDIAISTLAAIMETLRPILGAQFTEQEGKRILGTVFDPYAKPETNKKNIINLRTRLQKYVLFGDERSEYFETKGTLKGFNSASKEMKEKIAALPRFDGQSTFIGADGKGKREDTASTGEFPKQMSDGTSTAVASSQEDYNEMTQAGFKEVQ